MFRLAGSVLCDCVCVWLPPFCSFVSAVLIKGLNKAFLGSQMTALLKRDLFMGSKSSLADMPFHYFA